ncbi:hypothetical protein EYF80_011255 [Liparis tanakae]|uniref:Uncharacterized protein n=1 Tax=Liparis tanakae TaxID=230148 RepID=A0A4Z2IMN7_9TELE|nr:hypothetical protein EYF80_011255 [Liparis tanakae]
MPVISELVWLSSENKAQLDISTMFDTIAEYLDLDKVLSINQQILQEDMQYMWDEHNGFHDKR